VQPSVSEANGGTAAKRRCASVASSGGSAATEHSERSSEKIFQKIILKTNKVNCLF
jgi:hypothetical protein